MWGKFGTFSKLVVFVQRMVTGLETVAESGRNSLALVPKVKVLLAGVVVVVVGMVVVVVVVVVVVGRGGGTLGVSPSARPRKEAI